MGKIVYHKDNYIITEEHSKRGYIVINTEGTYENHGHVKSFKVAKTIIDLVQRKTIPYSDYLRHTALRLTLDNNYKMDILRKIEKDRNKEQYFNINKGLKGVRK